ncbi:RNA-directed DNA polymerase, eukaryota, Reverse transcriptase zinc-binding domain protein [Artemisia annua]|uniref:RNA-directed DNA polymerase, eukaryota, Reverse transcriptase zinc-binding domain protein n=1 Tax=Artemisia annua TaxID=35608 RepID=A0A2U1N9V7_ARTAN|nr:RNA-directed DNA polymerase, eukaryota, Reverse transcriptase zinc-binding domain protein [Artemisia annua]
MSVLAINGSWSDHSPILLRNQKVDYGPIPFRVFHSWFEVPGFHEVVLESYNDFSNDQGEACVDLKNKLKHVKGRLKLWHKEFKELKICTRKKLCEDILLIEKKMDDQMATIEELQNRAGWIKELAELDRIDVLDAAQKAKVKWDIEGDENTAFFHGLLKQRRRLQMVQGVMHDSEWCTDPTLVKSLFLDFYRDKFAAGQFHTPTLPQSSYNHLSAEEMEELERPDCSQFDYREKSILKRQPMVVGNWKSVSIIVCVGGVSMGIVILHVFYFMCTLARGGLEEDIVNVVPKLREESWNEASRNGARIGVDENAK